MATVATTIEGRRGVLAGRVVRWAVRCLIGLVVVIVVALASVTVSGAFGWRTMIVTSGSMEPAISPGDVIVLRPVAPEAIAEGDVIAFAPLEAEGTTTHRVVSGTSIDGVPHFQTKGDANDTPDPNLVPAPNVIGETVFHLPRVGSWLVHLGSPVMRVLLIGVPALLLIVDQLRGLRRAQRHAT